MDLLGTSPAILVVLVLLLTLLGIVAHVAFAWTAGPGDRARTTPAVSLPGRRSRSLALAGSRCGGPDQGLRVSGACVG